MKVPFADLTLQYLEIKSEIDAAIKMVVENSMFIGGKPVKEFEAALGASFPPALRLRGGQLHRRAGHHYAH